MSHLVPCLSNLVSFSYQAPGLNTKNNNNNNKKNNVESFVLFVCLLHRSFPLISNHVIQVKRAPHVQIHLPIHSFVTAKAALG